MVEATGKLLNQHLAYDRIINAEVALQLDEEVTTGKVTRRAIGPDGQVRGSIQGKHAHCFHICHP